MKQAPFAPQSTNLSTEQAQAILGAMPIVSRRLQHSRLMTFGVKALMLFLAVLIALPSPRLLACACAEVVGGAGAINSNMSVDESTGVLSLVQTDFNLPGLIPMQLTRTYESRLKNDGPFGPGWSVNMESYLIDTVSVINFGGAPTTGLQYWNGGDIRVSFNGQVVSFFHDKNYTNNDGTVQLFFGVMNEIEVFQASSKSRWVFDIGNGKLKRYIDRNGNTIQYTWKIVQHPIMNADDEIIDVQNIYCPLTITYPDDRQLVFTYGDTADDEALCQSVEGPGGITLFYGYTDGLLTEVRMGSGQDHVLHYSYQKSIINGKTFGVLDKITYANGAEIEVTSLLVLNQYPSAKVTKVEGPLGYNHTYQYQFTVNGNAEMIKLDSLNRTSGMEAIKGESGQPKFKIYKDALGRETTIEKGDKKQILSMTNPRGKATSFEYDSQNSNLLAQRNRTAVINALNKRWEYQYDSNNNVIKATNPLQQETHFSYNATGNLTGLTNGLGQTVFSATYTSEGLPATVADGLSRTVSYEYNTHGFLQKVTNAAGNYSTLTHDELGNVLTSTDPLGNTATFTYIGLNKVATATDALNHTSSFVYDEMTNLTQVTDANGNSSNFTYDLFQRRTGITNALDNTTTFTYDPEHNLTSLTDPLGNTYSYTFDAANNVTTFQFPDNSQESYAYDANDNLTSKTNRAGQEITYAYDGIDRLTTKTLPGGLTFNYSYDDANRLTGVVRQQGGTTQSSVSFTQNAADQITAVTADGKTVNYAYDLAQNLTKVIYPAGRIVNYNYDVRNQIAAITEGTGTGTNVLAYTKDDAGRITKVTLANGLETLYTYDAADRVTGIVLQHSASPNTVVQAFTYGYDNVGNRLWTQYQDTTGNTSGDVYQYDATYQVTGVKYGVSNPQAGYAAAQNAARTVTYAYDAVGNRISVNETIGSGGAGSGTSTTYTTNNLNQYTEVSATNYTYSTRGDLTSDGTWTYAYDAEGHLINATRPANINGNGLPALTVDYQYDINGNRIGKSVNGTPVAKYIYNGNNLIEEWNGAGNTLIASYTYAGGVDHPVKVVKGAAVYYFQQDVLGNVTALTDNSGNIVEQYTYDIYGQPTIRDGNGNAKTVPFGQSTATPLTSFLFTGREYDVETNLYHYRTRAYSADLGRFLQADSIDFNGGDVNIYRYVGNNSVNLIDPFGKIGFLATVGIGMAAGAVVGAITGGWKGGLKGAVSGAVGGAVTGALIGSGYGLTTAGAAGAAAASATGQILNGQNPLAPKSLALTAASATLGAAGGFATGQLSGRLANAGLAQALSDNIAEILVAGETSIGYILLTLFGNLVDCEPKGDKKKDEFQKQLDELWGY